MKSALTVIAVVFLALGATYPAPAAVPAGSFAQEAPQNVPLVVIRFNQRKVFYEQPLYNAIAKAVEIKPSVMFGIVSYVPQSGNAQIDSRTGTTAAAQTSEVIQSLGRMGVPRERLNIVTEADPSLQFHEVHVFVY